MKKKLSAVLPALFASLLLITVFSCSNDTKPSAPEYLTPVKTTAINPQKPYDGICWGLFENQITHSDKTPRNGVNEYAVVTDGKYAVYAPEGLQPKQKAVLILIPNGMTASEFAKGEIGSAWTEYAHETKRFAVAFLEPQDGKTWNTSFNRYGRDERAFIYDVFNSVKNKDVREGNYPFISVDKNAVSIIGYREGADMAAVLSASWPSIFPNTILIEPTKIETAVIEKVLAEGAYPHIVDSKEGYGAVKNGEIGMPVYIYSADADIKAEVNRIWNEVNSDPVNADSSLDKSLLKVTELESSSVEDIYAAAENNNRFMGYAGGTVRKRIDYSDPKFEFHTEEAVEGDLLRRWSVYTPDSFESGNPLVVVLHGSSACITDIPEESRWTDVADEEGFALLFIQGYPRASFPGQNPYPSWLNGNGNYDAETNIDLQYIGQLVDKVVEEKQINKERVYLTGHSLGAMMTLTVMDSSIAPKFAAFGPIGALPSPSYANVKPGESAGTCPSTIPDIPFWVMLGEWESTMYERGYPAFGMTASLPNWVEYMGYQGQTPDTAYEMEYGNSKKYNTQTYKNEEGAPTLKYTKVMDSPHTYMAEEAKMLWDEFFSHYKREDGKTVYSSEKL